MKENGSMFRREDGTKKAECKDRTAMEDVTHVEEIVQFSIDE